MADGDSPSGKSGIFNRGTVILAIWILGVGIVFAWTLTSFGGGTGVGADTPEPTTTSDDTGQLQGIELGTRAPDAQFSVGNDSTMELNEFSGERILIWFPVPTCETCQIQASNLESNRTKITNLTIIALTPTDSSSGASEAIDFAENHAPATLNESNWYWGTPSPEMMQTYNPESSHGLGYLINETGYVVARGSKPADNVGTIADFANGSV